MLDGQVTPLSNRSLLFGSAIGTHELAKVSSDVALKGPDHMRDNLTNITLNAARHVT
jgi:hypothetical protein